MKFYSFFTHHFSSINHAEVYLSLHWIPHSFSWWCHGSFKVTAMTIRCFIFCSLPEVFFLAFKEVTILFLRLHSRLGNLLKKVQWDICSSQYRLLWLDGDGGFQILHIPLLPGRDGQALRENYISTWRFVISPADMNLPEAFKTVLALRQKWEFQPWTPLFVSLCYSFSARLHFTDKKHTCELSVCIW